MEECNNVFREESLFSVLDFIQSAVMDLCFQALRAVGGDQKVDNLIGLNLDFLDTTPNGKKEGICKGHCYWRYYGGCDDVTDGSG